MWYILIGFRKLSIGPPYKENSCDCTGDCCSHCKFRASVTAHYRIHSLTEHIERYAQRNVKEVLFCKRVSFLVYRSAEQAENWFAEEHVNSRQHKGNHRQRENGGICGVAARAKIV